MRFVGGHSNSHVGPDPLNWSTHAVPGGIQGNVMTVPVPSLWLLSARVCMYVCMYVCIYTGAHNDVRSGKEEERATTTQKIKF